MAPSGEEGASTVGLHPPKSDFSLAVRGVEVTTLHPLCISIPTVNVTKQAPKTCSKADLRLWCRMVVCDRIHRYFHVGVVPFSTFVPARSNRYDMNNTSSSTRTSY